LPLEAAAISEAVERAKSGIKRGFTQSIDLIVNLRDLDLKSQGSKINESVQLPNPINQNVKVCVIGSGHLLSEAKKAGADRVIEKEELDTLGRNRKDARKIANEYGFFISDAQMMPLIGKSLGSFLGPRGKMPTPIPSNAPISPIINNSRRTIRVRVKDQPLIQCRVGLEDMPTDKLAENVQAILNRLEEKLEKGPRNIAGVYVKTTMGRPQIIKNVGKQK